MKKQLFVSATALALMMPYAASADDVNWNYVELDYLLIDDDDDTDGVRLKGAFEFTDGIFGFGEITTTDDDLNIVELGAGYAHTVANGTDVYGGLAVNYFDFDVDNGDDDTGFTLRAGVRSLVITELEVKAELVHVENDLLMDDDATAIDLGIQYLPIPELGIIAEYQVQTDSDNDDRIVLGARYNF